MTFCNYDNHKREEGSSLILKDDLFLGGSKFQQAFNGTSSVIAHLSLSSERKRIESFIFDEDNATIMFESKDYSSTIKLLNSHTMHKK